ncbi:MAG: ATP phosphoribosyltransferase regulatory subunit, partial [Hyphomicrobiales bacterium]|nr:ATP phosphoribosyltransferase regulatory subunit [Hyphomicrobiales bacterium]
MTATPRDSARPDARSAGEAALAHFLAAGFERIEPPVLQPAAIFLDMSGEEIRGRLYLTADPAGEEFCLRPEYTIPVCRAYLASPDAGRTAEYSYLGPVFRAQAGQTGERTQTGLESFGRKDAEAADAEIFALAMEAASLNGRRLAARLGDVGLFDCVLASLALPDVWRRRLKRGVAHGRSLAAILDGRGQSPLSQSGMLAAMESADHAGAKALVEDLLAIAGIDAVGGRTASEIADRFLEQAALRSGEPIDPVKRRTLEAYLSVSGDPDAAATKLRSLAHEARLDL